MQHDLAMVLHLAKGLSTVNSILLSGTMKKHSSNSYNNPIVILFLLYYKYSFIKIYLNIFIQTLRKEYQPPSEN